MTSFNETDVEENPLGWTVALNSINPVPPDEIVVDAEGTDETLGSLSSALVPYAEICPAVWAVWTFPTSGGMRLPYSLWYSSDPCVV